MYRTGYLIAELCLHFKRAEGLYRLRLHYLVLFDLYAVLLFQRVAYLLRGYRSEELSGAAGFCTDRDGDFAKTLCVFLGLGLFARYLRGLCLLLELECVKVIGCRLVCELAGQQIVAGVSVGYLLEFALLALTLDVSIEYNFHFLSFPVMITIQYTHLSPRTACLRRPSALCRLAGQRQRRGFRPRRAFP